MLVGERAVAVDVVGACELLGVPGLDLRVEGASALLADEEPELLEHRVALGAVLDERILLREGAEMDASRR